MGKTGQVGKQKTRGEAKKETAINKAIQVQTMGGSVKQCWCLRQERCRAVQATSYWLCEFGLRMKDMKGKERAWLL